MKDIETRDDIEKLLDDFYKKVVDDDLIGIFFTRIVQLDWEKHMPVMYDFWETTLLGNMKYKGNPMTKHFELNKKKALLPEHFNRWLLLWIDTVNKNFSGDKSKEAINRASQIGELMKFKMLQQN